jgi:hypothetical protein
MANQAEEGEQRVQEELTRLRHELDRANTVILNLCAVAIEADATWESLDGDGQDWLEQQAMSSRAQAAAQEFTARTLKGDGKHATFHDLIRLKAAMDEYCAAISEEEDSGRVDPPEEYFDIQQRAEGLDLALGETTLANVESAIGSLKADTAEVWARMKRADMAERT